MLYRKVLSSNGEDMKKEEVQAQLRVYRSSYDTASGRIGRLIGKLKDSFAVYLPKGYELAHFDFSSMEFRKGLNSIILDTFGLKAVIVDDSIDLVKETISNYNKSYKPKLCAEVEQEIPFVFSESLNQTLQESANHLTHRLPDLLNERKSKRKFETRFINVTEFFKLEICSNYVDCIRIRNAFIKNWLDNNCKTYNICYTQLDDVFFVAVDDDLSLKLGTEKSASLSK